MRGVANVDKVFERGRQLAAGLWGSTRGSMPTWPTTSGKWSTQLKTRTLPNVFVPKTDVNNAVPLTYWKERIEAVRGSWRRGRKISFGIGMGDRRSKKTGKERRECTLQSLLQSQLVHSGQIWVNLSLATSIQRVSQKRQERWRFERSMPLWT